MVHLAYGEMRLKFLFPQVHTFPSFLLGVQWAGVDWLWGVEKTQNQLPESLVPVSASQCLLCGFEHIVPLSGPPEGVFHGQHELQDSPYLRARENKQTNSCIPFNTQPLLLLSSKGSIFVSEQNSAGIITSGDPEVLALLHPCL